jgi:hypothetical protein
MYPDNRDDSSALAPNDPYKKMDRRDTRPDFLAARSNLSKSEQSAAAAPDAIMDGGTNRAKSAEQNQAYSPRFSGKGLPEITDEKRKSKGFFKRKGPLLAILTLLIGGGGLMAGSQMLMPFATANRIIQEFNSMKTVMSKRSDRILRYQMDTERYKNPTRVTIFGNEKFKLSNKQIGKLKTEGIDVMEVDVNERNRQAQSVSGQIQYLHTYRPPYDEIQGYNRPVQ